MIERTSIEEFAFKQVELIYNYLAHREAKEKDSFEYLTRQQTAGILQVSLVTFNNWSKINILTCYVMGNRVYHKMQNILDRLKSSYNDKAA